jgi:hypothetical protein
MALGMATKTIKDTFDINQILTVFAGHVSGLKQKSHDARTLPPT